MLQGKHISPSLASLLRLEGISEIEMRMAGMAHRRCRCQYAGQAHASSAQARLAAVKAACWVWL